MSTRLRPIVMLNGDVVTGGSARMWLENMANTLKLEIPPRGSMPEAERLIHLYTRLPLGNLGRTALWLFREPRDIHPNRSRYMQLAQYYGIGPRGKKERLTFTIQVDRIVERQRQARLRQERAEQEEIISRTARELARRQQGISQPPIDWVQQQANQPMFSSLTGLGAQGVSTRPTTGLGFDWAPTVYTWDPPSLDREEP